MEGGQPGTQEQALVARQDSPCKSSNSNGSLLCLVWKKLQEGRPSSLLFFSAPQAISLLLPAPLPKLAASLPPGRPGAQHHSCSGTSSHRQPPTHFTRPQEKSWLIKHRCPAKAARVAGHAAEVCAAWQPRAFLHQTTGRADHTPPASLPGEAPNSFTFTAVCFSINNIPISLACFLKHLV